MVTNFPNVEMLQYLFDDMWLFDESDDYHFALAGLLHQEATGVSSGNGPVHCSTDGELAFL